MFRISRPGINELFRRECERLGEFPPDLSMRFQQNTDILGYSCVVSGWGNAEEVEGDLATLVGDGKIDECRKLIRQVLVRLLQQSALPQNPAYRAEHLSNLSVG